MEIAGTRKIIWSIESALEIPRASNLARSAHRYPLPMGVRKAKGDEGIGIREYIDCSLAWTASLVLVESFCHQPLLSCGATIRCKTFFFIVLLTT